MKIITLCGFGIKKRNKMAQQPNKDNTTSPPNQTECGMGYLQEWWEERYPASMLPHISNVSDGVLEAKDFIDFSEWMVKKLTSPRKKAMKSNDFYSELMGVIKAYHDDHYIDNISIERKSKSKTEITLILIKSETNESK